jgi:hypothetical protein
MTGCQNCELPALRPVNIMQAFSGNSIAAVTEIYSDDLRHAGVLLAGIHGAGWHLIRNSLLAVRWILAFARMTC